MNQLKTRMNDAFLEQLIKSQTTKQPQTKPQFAPAQPTTFRQILSSKLQGK